MTLSPHDLLTPVPGECLPRGPNLTILVVLGVGLTLVQPTEQKYGGAALHRIEDADKDLLVWVLQCRGDGLVESVEQRPSCLVGPQLMEARSQPVGGRRTYIGGRDVQLDDPQAACVESYPARR